MFKSAAISFLLFVSTVISGYSQEDKDTIVLLNGDRVIASVIDTTNGVTSFKNPKNPKKNFIIENDRIFSINNPKGENIIYAYDTVIGNEFTIDEMRYFIRGEQDADKGFKAPGAFWGNLALAAGAGVTGSFLSPVPPFVFVALVGAPKVNIKKETVSNLEYLNHTTYLMGYERVARKKRKIKSLIGGGIGLSVGLGTFFILKANGAELLK
jgi:hypothetical protein